MQIINKYRGRQTMDGLLIKEPWINYIFEGKKVWEIRGCATSKRGTIALIKSRSGCIFGTVDLIDCTFLTHEKYRESVSKHMISYDQTALYPYKKTYAWVFDNPKLFEKPLPYQHPNGAVIWVKLDGF